MAWFDRSHTSSYWRSMALLYLVSLPRWSEILVENSDFFIPHLHSTPRYGGSRRIITIRFELDNGVATRWWKSLICVLPFRHNVSVCQTDILHTHHAVKTDIGISFAVRVNWSAETGHISTCTDPVDPCDPTHCLSWIVLAQASSEPEIISLVGISFLRSLRPTFWREPDERSAGCDSQHTRQDVLATSTIKQTVWLPGSVKTVYGPARL